jgi:hypothetical protein
MARRSQNVNPDILAAAVARENDKNRRLSSAKLVNLGLEKGLDLRLFGTKKKPGLLTGLGYRSLLIGGSRPGGQTGYVGNTEGAPDRFVRHDAWPVAVWIGVELKRPDGKGEVRTAQAELRLAGATWIVLSEAEMLACLISTECDLGIPSTGRVARIERIEDFARMNGWADALSAALRACRQSVDGKIGI